jgi:hypothetical protein
MVLMSECVQQARRLGLADLDYRTTVLYSNSSGRGSLTQV